MKRIEVGDIISALGHAFTVAKIMYQDYWDRFGFDCEFLDDLGNYHHWKQWDDGGDVIRQEKTYTNCYGSDCTDIFRKYGY